MRMLSNQVAKLDTSELSLNYVGHIVRMQEEIGTGGAGFRFLYSAFLQEAAHVTGDAALADCARDLTAAGDQWRVFALTCARMCKDREAMDYGKLAGMLQLCAVMETDVYAKLRKAKA